MVQGGVGSVIGGRYHLDREIGRGGMGAVWLGHDAVLQRSVAVKSVGRTDGFGENTAHRAQREARLAANLSHPHVVAMLDLVREDDQMWLVMEHLDCVNLTQLVRRDGPLTPDAAAPLLAQAAEALAAAHRVGIVHRDVKPSNMLVTSDRQVKLSDFGIARARGDATLTRTGLVIGSPAYLAPEVARGEIATEASDVWSFGVTAYFTLTGEHAYETEAGHVMATLHRIVSEDPPWPPDPGWLAPLFAGTLVIDPADRWSMGDVTDFLTRRPAALSGVPGVVDTRPNEVRRRAAAVPVPAGQETVALRPVREPPPPAAPPPVPRGRRGRAVPALLAAVVVLALLLGGAWLVGRDGGQDGATPTSPSAGSGTPTTQPAQGGATPTAAGMTAFIRSYLTTVTVDQRAGWDMLTPGFQAASAPYSGYVKAWQGRPYAVASNIVADPESLRISYDIAYRDPEGKPLRGGSVTLRLAYDDGVYKIADEV